MGRRDSRPVGQPPRSTTASAARHGERSRGVIPLPSSPPSHKPERMRPAQRLCRVLRASRFQPGCDLDKAEPQPQQKIKTLVPKPPGVPCRSRRRQIPENVLGNSAEGPKGPHRQFLIGSDPPRGRPSCGMPTFRPWTARRLRGPSGNRTRCNSSMKKSSKARIITINVGRQPPES